MTMNTHKPDRPALLNKSTQRLLYRLAYETAERGRT
jgi:hypothetical protein